MDEARRYYSIPKLAARIGVTTASVRDWIARGYVEGPPTLPVTGEKAYPAEAANRLERWYFERAASGKTRGPSAALRRTRAIEKLRQGKV